jgi:hypothetical protein
LPDDLNSEIDEHAAAINNQVQLLITCTSKLIIRLAEFMAFTYINWSWRGVDSPPSKKI